MGYYMPARPPRKRRQAFHLGRYDGRDCPYCGDTMRVRYPNPHHHRDCPTRDHVIPRCHGGMRVIVVCRDCNNRKADKTPADWLRYVAVWRPDRVAQVRAVFAGVGVYLDTVVTRG